MFHGFDYPSEAGDNGLFLGTENETWCRGDDQTKRMPHSPLRPPHE